MKKSVLISACLLMGGHVVGKFAPFLGELLGLSGVLVALLAFIVVLFTSAAERGY